MKLRNISIALCAAVLTACGGPDPVSLVDPMIGSGGHGHVFVGASVPNGMVQLGPTRITRGWDWCSGYAYRDSIILGFIHTHLSGTGIGDLGDVMLLPFDPARRQYTDALYDQNAGTSPKHLYARLDHSLEKVEPGFYSLEMPDYGVSVRLTYAVFCKHRHRESRTHSKQRDEHRVFFYNTLYKLVKGFFRLVHLNISPL